MFKWLACLDRGQQLLEVGFDIRGNFAFDIRRSIETIVAYRC